MIAGASGSIGVATIAKFIGEGWDVIALVSSKEGEVKILKKIKEMDLSRVDQLRTYVCNVNHEKDLNAFNTIISNKEKIINCFISLIGIVNPGTFLLQKVDQFESTFTTNFLGPLRLLRPVIRVILRNKVANKSIIFASSISARSMNMGRSSYASSKGAIESFISSLSSEVAPYQIRVNGVAPGLIDTPMLKSALSDSTLNSFSDRIPLQRLGRVEEVSNTIYFLASDQASYITGTVLRIDGGLM
jgi:3-oxoacyl-[acyl-carrier protein] reductase